MGLGLGAAAIVAGIFGGWGSSSNAGDETARRYAPQVARDGFEPTPTPSPTPVPPPPVAAKCFQPRPADTTPFVYLPSSPKSFFRNCQVISYYGYPGVPGLGVLGQYATAEAMVNALRDQVEAFDAVNGARTVLPAFHIIAATAQPYAYGTALGHIPTETLEAYIALAEQNDFLVFIDLQMGHSDVATEVGRVLPYLHNPRVHLALDPEWALPLGIAPGDEIGSMDVSEINLAQQMLQTAWEETGGPNKILVVHQFRDDMIIGKAELQSLPNVDVVIDMDGFGGQGIKLANYNRFIVDDAAPHSGMKLFYDPSLDVGRFTPAEASALVPQPDIVQYQ